MAKNSIIEMYYSTVEFHPMNRVDIKILFFKEMASRGIKCVYYTRNDGSYKKRIYYNNDQKILLPFSLKNFYLLNKLTYWLSDIYNIYNFARKKNGIVQVRDKYVAALFGLLICKLYNIKFVYWLSYPFPEHKIELSNSFNGIKSLVYYMLGSVQKIFLYKIIMPSSDHCFVQSERMKLDVVKYGVLEEKMTSVPMGVSRELVKNNDSIIKRKKQIIYLGSLSQVRKLDILIDVMINISSKNDDITLLIVGEGESEKDKKLLVSKVDRYGLNDRITFTGQIPFDDAILHVKESYVGISPFYPSPVLLSASPTKIVEYMALGIPVVANAHPEQKYIIEQSGGGMLVNWSVEDFSAAILSLFNNPARSKKMGECGKIWVENNRTYDVIADDVYRAYLNILEKVND